MSVEITTTCSHITGELETIKFGENKATFKFKDSTTLIIEDIEESFLNTIKTAGLRGLKMGSVNFLSRKVISNKTVSKFETPKTPINPKNVSTGIKDRPDKPVSIGGGKKFQ